jgi:hypothetical protein
MASDEKRRIVVDSVVCRMSNISAGYGPTSADPL